MKKIILITLCALTLSWVVNAQNVAHTVAKNETLYRISVQFKNDGSKWKEIFDMNPQVVARGIDTTADGLIIAHVLEGEIITLTPEAYTALTGDSVVVEPAKATATEILPKKAEKNAVVTPVVTQSSIDWPFWLVVIALVLFSATVIGLINSIASGKAEKMLKQLRHGKDVYNPETAGTPVIDGGMHDANNVGERLRESFVRNHNKQNPGNQVTYDQTSFIRGAKGKAYSDGRITDVEYRGGTSAERILTGQESWEGIVRNLTNNTETRVIALAACGNAVVKNLQYVRFVPDAIQQTIITDGPVIENGIQLTASKDQVEGAKAIAATLAEPFKLNGGTFSLTKNENGFVMTYTINAPAQHQLPELNGTFKGYLVTPLKKGELAGVQKAEKTA